MTGATGAMRGIGEPAWIRVGLTVACVAVMGLLLALPLVLVFVEAFSKGAAFLWASLSEPDAVAAIRLTLLVAALAVPINTVFGLTAAWCVSRFRFLGRGALVALIELPFSISPVISGLAYVLLFGLQGWFGPLLERQGIHIIFAVPGIVLVTVFVTSPFVARQLMPLMAAQGVAEEEAALTLGASGWQMFWRVTLPRIGWALLTGVLLCTARAMGEFGAVSVVSGHIRGLTDTMPLHIEILYNEYQVAAAFAMSALLTCLALVTIALRGVLEWRSNAATQRGQRAVRVRA